MSRPIEIRMIPCGCGCGATIPNYNKTSHHYTGYKRGHNNHVLRHPGWPGSRRKDHRGYWIIYLGGRSIKEHRLVYEESRNCCLLKSTIIHHIDGDPGNNTWSNLIPYTHAQHGRVEYGPHLTSKGHTNRSWLGKHLSEETKRKISEKARARKKGGWGTR